MTTAIPSPRLAAELELEQAAPPVVFSRSLVEIDRDLADLAVREARLTDQLAGSRRALFELAAQRDVLLAQKARAVALVRAQLAAAG